MQAGRALGQVEEQHQIKRDGRGKNRVAAKEIDLNLHRIAEPAKDVDVVPAFLVVSTRRVVVDADLVEDVLVEVGVKFGLEDVFERAELGLFLGLEGFWIVQNFAVTVAQNVGGVPSGDAKQAGLEGRRKNRLHEGLAGLEVLAANGRGVLFGELDHGRHIDGEVRRTVGKGHALAERGVGINLRRCNAGIAGLQSLLKGLDGLMHGRRLEEDLGGAAPDHHHAVNLALECADVLAQLVGELSLVLALLYVRAIQALHVVLVKHGRHGLNLFQVGLQLGQQFLVEDARVRGGLIHVVLEDVPAGEDDVVQVGERNKVLDEGRVIVRALAKADGAHLRE